MAQKRKHSAAKKPPVGGDRDAEVRIIGGRFRGRRLNYHGDPVVRPMKHRTREAIFNLISTGCDGRHAVDLFAGTGALGLEAISRGSPSATFIEKHVPTARVVEENIRALGVEDQSTVVVTSAFLWAKRDLPTSIQSTLPWLAFCSPPYAFFRDRLDDMRDLVARVRQHAPHDSLLIVEAEEPFDFNALKDSSDESHVADDWDIRTYAPAIVGIWHKAT